MADPFSRRDIAALLVGAAASAAIAPAALAQSYPTRPIRMIVPFPPGGGVDSVGRLLANRLNGVLGQPVVVENRAGAGGAIGVEAMANAAPDGYTICMVSPGNMTAGPVVRPTPYDPLALGFVTRLVRSPLLLLCRPTLPARDLAEFVAMLRREPDRIRFASGGVGTGTHLAGELMNLRLGVRMTHVPYRGTAPALTDLVAGNVDIFFSDTSAWPMVQQAQLRLLAVSTSDRWSLAPDVPAVNDAVADFDLSNWYGVMAPPATPEPLRARLAEAMAGILTTADVTEFLARIGFEPAPLATAEFEAFVHGETEIWRNVVRSANISAD